MHSADAAPHRPKKNVAEARSGAATGFGTLGLVAESVLAGKLDPGPAGDRFQVTVHVEAEALADPARGWVALGGYPPRAPTDPDMQNSRIRLLGVGIRYGRGTPCMIRGLASGYRARSRRYVSQVRCPAWERRLSHFRHRRSTWRRKQLSDRELPVTP